MNTALVKRELLESLKDQEFREAFNEEHVYTSICFQIRALREQRQKSQKELGLMVEPMMAPERISILEDPNATTKPNVATLLRLANAFKIGLDIRFVPYGTVIYRSVHTETKELEVPEFDAELPGLELRLEREFAGAQRETPFGKSLGWDLLQGGKQNEPKPVMTEADATKRPIENAADPYKLVRA